MRAGAIERFQPLTASLFELHHAPGTHTSIPKLVIRLHNFISISGQFSSAAHNQPTHKTKQNREKKIAKIVKHADHQRAEAAAAHGGRQRRPRIAPDGQEYCRRDTTGETKKRTKSPRIGVK